MTGTPAAAVFFSLISIVASWIAWFVFFRDYRADALRLRLLLLELDAISARGSDEALRIAELARRAKFCAELLTATRLLLAAAISRAPDAAHPQTDGQPDGYARRLTDAVARYAFPAIPAVRRWLTVHALETALETVERGRRE